MISSHRTIAAVILVAAGIASAASWQWRHPIPAGSHLADVAIASEGTSWAVGAAGTILRSIDGGKTWQIIRPNVSADLRGVVLAGRDGWIVGAGGTILRSANGGPWTAQRSGVAVDLADIDMLDGQTGWAAGAGGLVLATADGGGRWRAIRQGGNVSIAAIGAFDRDRIVAVGWRAGAPHGAGVIVRSTDGGRTWTNQTFGPAYRLTGLWVERGGQRAWAVGAPTDVPNMPPFLLGSTDGGATWTPHKLDVSGALFDIIAEGRIVTAVGRTLDGTAWVMQSMDGGERWRSRAFRIPAGLRAIDGTAPTRLVAVGEGGLTLDPSAALRETEKISPRATIRGIDFANDSRGCAVGDAGLILRTDDGATWLPSDAYIPADLVAVAWTSRDVAYAVGTGGTMVRTLDGGHSWSQQEALTESDLRDIDARQNDVWIVGFDGVVLRSTDRGNTWNRVPPPAQETFTAVSIAPDGETFILSLTGGLWQAKREGGWTRLDLAAGGAGLDLATPAPGNLAVLATPDSGASILHRSVDRGKTWIAVRVPRRAEGIAFSEPTVGVVAAEGAVYVTRDGRKWQSMQIAGAIPLHGATFVAGKAWAVGEFATIIRVEP